MNTNLNEDKLLRTDHDERHEYRIITELGGYGMPSSDLDDTIGTGFDNLPAAMSWEVRDESETVVFTHYIEEEGE